MSRNPKPSADTPPTVGGLSGFGSASHLSERDRTSAWSRPLSVFPLLGRRQPKAASLATGFGGEPGDVRDRLVQRGGVDKREIGRPALEVTEVGEQRLDF
jgi:hypothetical protein